MKSNRTKLFMFRLSNKEHDFLRRYSFDNRKPMAQVVRLALDKLYKGGELC